MFDKRFYPHLWLLIIYIPFVFIVKEFLPQNIARENGPKFSVSFVSCWDLFMLAGNEENTCFNG